MTPLPTAPPAVSLTALAEGVSVADVGLQPSDLDLIKAGQPPPAKTISSALPTPTTWTGYMRLPPEHKAPWTAAIQDDSVSRRSSGRSFLG